MEQKLNSTLPFIHISKAANEIISYIDKRRKGISKSLRTRWPKFNRQCMGGVEPNTIYVVAGISGSGKSSFVNSLETDLFDLNPKEDFVILSFSFEMLSSKQVGRKLSYRMSRTTSELYSASNRDENYKVSENEFETAVNHAEEIKKYPIYYVEFPGTVEEIKNTIISFAKLPEIKGKWIVIILDHTLLTKSSANESERATLVNLQRMFMEIKKYGRNTIIEITQLNREIEDKDRLVNPTLHYPMRRDIQSSDAIFQSADYVIVLHRPEVIGIERYGPYKLPVENMIYMHFLKCREGEPKILSFENNLKYNRIDECNTQLITSN
jgi:replicative DNA helicase